MNTYLKIEHVLRQAARPLAPHEFHDVLVSDQDGGILRGREYVGCSESTLGRRLRELREMDRVKSQRRDGKNFVEYAPAEHPTEAAGA